jgi:small subunit ribosomal protein S9
MNDMIDPNDIEVPGPDELTLDFPVAAPPVPPKIQRVPYVSTGPTKGNWFWGTGRRKTAVARVRVRPGSGKFNVNERPHDKFFTEERDRNNLVGVLKKTSTEGKLDIEVNVFGGGYMGQAGAIVLGLGRALMNYDPALEPILRDNDYLTRDSRKVERKKYGQSGARRRFQFSKR